MKKVVVRRAAAVAAAIAVVYLLAGIGAAARPFNADDFRHDWAAGKALVRGQDFYDGRVLQRIWAEDPVPGAVPGTPARLFLNAPHYALFAAPFSAAPFPTAKVAFAVVTLLGYAAGIVVLGAALARGWSRPAKLAALGTAAGFAPLWFAVASGQASPVVFAFLVGACAALLAGRESTAGTLLALAAFKPTMGFLLLPYLAYRRKWKALGVSVAVTGVLSLAALARAGFGAAGSYLHALRVSQTGVNSPFGPASGSDLSLLPLAARIVTPDRHALAYAVFAVTLAALGLALWTVMRRTRGGTWLECALILLVCQLAVYHRAYDAVVVILAGAVALSQERIRRTPLALAVAIASVFLVANAHAPLSHGSWLWDVVVLSHRTWAILALFAVLCWSGLGAVAPHAARE